MPDDIRIVKSSEEVSTIRGCIICGSATDWQVHFTSRRPEAEGLPNTMAMALCMEHKIQLEAACRFPEGEGA